MTASIAGKPAPSLGRPLSRKTITNLGLGLLVFVTAVAVAYPVYWMLIASFQPSGAAQSDQAWLYPNNPSLQAYAGLFAERPMGQWLINTVVVTLASTAVALVTAVFGAYALARFRFHGRTTILFVLLLTQLVPASSLIIPLFLTFRAYGMYDNIGAIAIAYASFTIPEAVWLMWGYYQNLSEDFEHAAMVDGCSQFGAFRRITLPLSLPGLVATTLFCFLEGWNQYLLAYVLTSAPANWVVSLGLFSFIGEFSTDVEQMMAASVVASIPPILVFVLLQRYLKGGLTMGGVTG